MSEGQKSLFTDEVKALVGTKVLDDTAMPVPVSDIQYYCEATRDENPLYLDKDYAKKTRLGGIVAPFPFYDVPFFHAIGSFRPVRKGGENVSEVGKLREKFKWASLHVGHNMEFGVRVRPGDVLTRKGKITEIVPKKIKLGDALLCTIETIFTNQKGEIVCLENTQYFFWPLKEKAVKE